MSYRPDNQVRNGLLEPQQHQVRPSEAHDLVVLVFGWFTEGFQTADLKEAKALLDELTEPAIAAAGE